MPVSVSYPGVYIEELPSGVRTLVGVATSITAFVGRALRGPENQPVTINGFGDFERIFGGLWVESTLGFAARDFFSNGGSEALIVRLFREDANALARLRFGSPASLVLAAASAGTWGNNLAATVDHDVTADAADRLGVTVADLFNLTVTDTVAGVTEVFRNVTVIDSPRVLDRVLAQDSALVRVEGGMPSARPAVTAVPVVVLAPDRADDGQDLDETTYLGNEGLKTGLFALEKADLFNLLVIPPPTFASDLPVTVWTAAAEYCGRRRAMLLIDASRDWNTVDEARTGLPAIAGPVGSNKKNAALFFPYLRMPNLLRSGMLDDFAPGGAVAGVFARTDASRGVWKAPAGLEANLNGVLALAVPMTDLENGRLNPLGINCLRVRPAAGPVVWGARTVDGDDRLASEWKYVPVRRLALFLEESLYRGLQWVVFEPNDEPLWAQIRLNVGAFLQGLFRQGAFQGRTPQEAYFVKVDRETTTQNDIDRGIVNVVVGFAPLKPAEFVIIKIQQIAGQLQT